MTSEQEDVQGSGWPTRREHPGVANRLCEPANLEKDGGMWKIPDTRAVAMGPERDRPAGRGTRVNIRLWLGQQASFYAVMVGKLQYRVLCRAQGVYGEF